MKTFALTLYATDLDWKGKNAIFDDIETDVLADSFSNMAVSNIQFQKIQRYMSIDVKLISQIPEVFDPNRLSPNYRFNYCKLVETDSEEEQSQSFYFFITKETWLSNGGTVRYDLEMDVLNTYKLVSGDYNDLDLGSNLAYSLSNRCHIHRMHKDRLTLKASTNTQPLIKFNPGGSSEFVDLIKGGTVPISDSGKLERFVILNSFDWNIDQLAGSWIICWGLDTDGNPNCKGFRFRKIRKTDGYAVTDLYVQGIGIIRKTDGIVYLETLTYVAGDKDDRNSYSASYIKLTGTQAQTDFESYWYVIDYEWLRESELDQANMWAYIIDYPQPADLSYISTYRFLTSGDKYFVRVIDRRPEGINPILFKKSEYPLLDKDQDKTWFLVYANANPPASGSDTSAIYINPVNISFLPSKPIEKISGTVASVSVYPTALNYPGKLSALVFSYNQLQGGCTVSFTDGGTPVTLTIGAWGGTDPSAVVVYRYYAENHFYIRSCVYNSKGGIVGETFYDNIASIAVTNCGSCKRLTSFYTDDYRFVRDPYVPTHGQLGPVYDFYIGAGTSSSVGTSVCIDDLDLTDEKLIKVIEFPYAPLDWLVGIDTYEIVPEGFSYNVGTNMLQANNENIPSFVYEKTFPGVFGLFDDMIVDAPESVSNDDVCNHKFESKLFNSEFSYPKFFYDSFSFSFNLEQVSFDKLPSDWYVFRFDYCVSKNIVSKFAFRFSQYREALIDGSFDFDGILTVTRNNEKALFNNAYLNYLRQGLAYDRKNMESNNVARGVGIALTTIGAIASFASSPFTGGVGVAGGIGLLTSLGGQVAGAIHSANQADRAIQEKQAELQRQSETVSTAEDLDILHFVEAHKPRLAKYSLSSYMEPAVYSLFYWFGYSTDLFGNPLDYSDSRIGFNFVQADIDFLSFLGGEEEREALIDSYKEGVYFVHDVSIFFAGDSRGDIENWEKTIYEAYNP